jgi:hypothetical protein
MRQENFVVAVGVDLLAHEEHYEAAAADEFFEGVGLRRLQLGDVCQDGGAIIAEDFVGKLKIADNFGAM